MGGDLRRLLFQFLNRNENRRATDSRRATAECANAVLDHARVAVNDCDVIKVDAEFIRGDLRERSFLPLTVRRSAGENRDFSRRLDANSCAFPATGGHSLRWPKRANLDIARQTDADHLAFIAC